MQTNLLNSLIKGYNRFDKIKYSNINKECSYSPEPI